jgi:hypothetical protein
MNVGTFLVFQQSLSLQVIDLQISFFINTICKLMILRNPNLVDGGCSPIAVFPANFALGDRPFSQYTMVISKDDKLPSGSGPTHRVLGTINTTTPLFGCTVVQSRITASLPEILMVISPGMIVDPPQIIPFDTICTSHG